MAFSHKASLKRAIKKLKYREEIFKKIGKVPKAQELRRRIDRLLKQ